MTAPPGNARSTGNTVRPADKGASRKGVDPAAVRMAVNGYSALTGCRRKEARAFVLAWSSEHGGTLDGWSHWLRDWHGIADPTGESVVRTLAGGGA